jgi:hypothetical protein
MGGTVTRQRLLSAFVAVVAGFGVRIADASPPPASSLEQQAAEEFAQTGFAVRERLDREAAGDPIGASIAAHEAELHRYRYLDLKRELSRRHPQPPASPSVAAPHDPFMPDDSFSEASGAATTRAIPKIAAGRGEVARTTYASWDMYRPRLSMAEADTGSTESSPAMRATNTAPALGQAKDMYATDRPKRTPSDQRPSSMDPEGPVPSADPPRQPFLVYRDQWASPGTRK